MDKKRNPMLVIPATFGECFTYEQQLAYLKKKIEEGGGGYPEPTGTILITRNGTVDVKDYATADVEVPEPSGKITITSNGTDIDVKNYATADVDVPEPSGTITIVRNGTVDVKDFASAFVNVPQETAVEVQMMHDMIDNESTAVVESYTIPSDITDIRAGSCRYLQVTNITGPEVEKVGNDAFQNPKMETLSLPKCVRFFESVLRNATLLRTVTLPLLQTSANQNFRDCPALESLSLPELTNIGTYNFYGCNALTELRIPKVNIITDNCIYNLQSLRALSLLSAIQIRNSIRSCENLTDLFLPSNTFTSVTNGNAFNDTPIKAGTGHVWVNDEQYDNYISGTNWSNLPAGVIRKISEYTGSFDYTA